jgi:predicted ATPase
MADAGDHDRGPLGGSDGGLVGRREVLAQLRGAVEAAARGRGQVILLSGEAGIGKTAVAAEAAAARERGARVLWASCWQGDGAPGYWPWVQVARLLSPAAGAPLSGAGEPAVPGPPAETRELMAALLAGVAAAGTVVPLAALNAEEVGEVIAGVLGGEPAPGLVAEVHRRTGGNHMFVQELARLLGARVPAPGGLPLAGPATAEAWRARRWGCTPSARVR